MRILFGIKSMDVPGGGAERVLSVVASGLAARGHDVWVATFDAPGGRSFYALDARVERLALGVGPTDRPTGAADFVARVRALRRALRARPPDVAVGFMHSMFVPLSFASAGAGVPVVASEHIVPEYYRGRRGQFALLVAACLLARRVTVLSAAVRELYPAFLRGRMVAIANPVAPPAPRAAARPPDARTVLAVGRLEDQKDHATLIDAFARVAPRFPDWSVRIVGDGSLRAALEHRIARHGLEGRVALAPVTADVGAEYASAQLLAVPSRFESFGMATAEAMAVGLPVLGFADCPGTNELVRHDHDGWLVNGAGGDRVAAFADGLATLMGGRELRERLGAEARRSLRPFEPEHVVSEWERLLGEVAAR